MTQIKFGTPKDVTNPGYDGVKIKFPFLVIEPGSGAFKDKVTHHCIVVDIVRTLLTTWGFTRSDYDPETLHKHLFEYAREAAIQNLVEGSLAERHDISLGGISTPYKNPFDPSKLSDPDGAIYEIDLERAREMHRLQEKESRSLGFKFSQ